MGDALDQLIGRDLDGRYTIVDQIGRGGMGAIYRATQHGLGREVAVKVVTPALLHDEIAIKRFLREAKLASRLSHPNAVAVLDFGQTSDGLFYLVMELVRGRTLDQVFAEGALTPARVVRIGTQICDALEGAHALQIIHRDLKPANIMVMAASRDLVKVLDFGLAKSLMQAEGAVTMMGSSSLVGTPAFMPPEAATGGTVDARSDLYSLGCVLYEATMGKPPFEASFVPAIIAMHATEPVPPLIGAPVGLARVIERLLEKDPARRFPSAAATREALEGALAASKEVVTADAPLSTMLGWATPAPRARGSGESQPIAKPTPTPLPAPTLTPTPLPVPRPEFDDEEDLLTSLPTVFSPHGIAPVVPPAAKQAPRTDVVPAAPTRSLVPWIVVLVLAAAFAGFAIVRFVS